MGETAPSTSATKKGTFAVGAIIGVVTACVAIGVAHLVAGVVNPQASPIITVGQAAIDLSPEWLKSFAISAFGSGDKDVLLIGIGVVVLFVAVALGVASVRQPRVGVLGLLALGAIGVVAAASRPTAEPADYLPAIAGTSAGLLAFVLLRRVANLGPGAGTRADSLGPDDADMLNRRRLLWVGAAGAVGAVAVAGLGGMLARRFRADASRASLRAPVPEAAAVEVPPGVQLEVPGLGPFFTPNDRFYRVDTALLVPAVEAEGWRLRIHGMVEHEITLDYQQLLDRDLIERDITLACVSNRVGGQYVGNARWIGTPLKPLLEEAGVASGADQVVTRSVDGFTIGTPTSALMDGRDAMLAVAMNGEPLPLDHGFPVRMIVPGLYGYVSATKWIVDMELTTFDAFDAYWVERGWAQQAPIKTMSRIDTPSGSRPVPAGEVAIAGVAWAQHRGIDSVEVRIDDEAWRRAELAVEDTVDTWRQWIYRWEAASGDHRVQVRATDGMGETQTAARATPFPDGATGYHTIFLKVA